MEVRGMKDLCQESVAKNLMLEHLYCIIKNTAVYWKADCG